MKWRKLGKIFDPSRYSLPNSCIEFAQSPQTLVFDDFVRIYFSTRQKDSTGSYLSHIAFVDMDKSFKTIVHISEDTVIPLGALGTFDEHGIFPMHVFRDNDRIAAYTCGWSRRISVPVETSIGYAISYDNGRTFIKEGSGPIMTSTLQEPFLVGDPFVIRQKEKYHMWYIYGCRWMENTQDKSPSRVYKIAHATSPDGISWTKEGKQIITDKINPDECQALPTVLFHQNRFHMYFCYRHADGFRNNRNRAYRIGYAWSDDLMNWVREDNAAGIDVSDTGWDSDMMCYPHIFSMEGRVFLLYNGNEFGKRGFGLAVLE